MADHKIVYCPRCDRPFTSKTSRAAAIRAMGAHVKKAHPEYLPMMKD